MEGSVRHRRGGIFGLAQLIEQHGEAIQFELLSRGRTLDDLGTKRLSWWDLKVLIRHLPHGNALQRERMGEGASWTADTYLLALIGDALQGANWQRANAGSKNRTPIPKPIPRPQLEGQMKQGRRLGAGKGVSIEQMKQRLGWE